MNRNEAVADEFTISKGFDAAQQFHPVFGPILMVAFAVLSQTLRKHPDSSRLALSATSL